MSYVRSHDADRVECPLPGTPAHRNAALRPRTQPPFCGSSRSARTVETPARAVRPSLGTTVSAICRSGAAVVEPEQYRPAGRLETSMYDPRPDPPRSSRVV